VSKDKRSDTSGRDSFGLVDFLLRWLAAIVLVFLTYNPSGWSYVHWVKNVVNDGALGPLHFLAGAVLIAGWSIFIVATRRSLGDLGLFLGAAVLALLVWFLVDVGWLGFDSITAISWVVLVCVSVLLALGLSWSHVWRRMTGQLEVDDAHD
jgi:hypothetical protein